MYFRVFSCIPKLNNILAALSKRWKAQIYACYVLPVEVEYTNDAQQRPFLNFRCFAKGCKTGVRRYLDKKDASTKNLHTHAETCWGEDVVNQVNSAKNATIARSAVTEPYRKNGKITDVFERKGEKKTYSHMQLTKAETNDDGFVLLMKTGRPGYYVPSASTVSRDVKKIFAKSRIRIAKMLQTCGRVSFQVDGWTSPNHKAYVGITATFELAGVIKTIVLDIVEVAKSHSGVNLAAAF
ncbi:hypothetical protein BDN72DRAFT_780160, partial [Pluteus cervinus]